MGETFSHVAPTVEAKSPGWLHPPALAEPLSPPSQHSYCLCGITVPRAPCSILPSRTGGGVRDHTSSSVAVAVAVAMDSYGKRSTGQASAPHEPVQSQRLGCTLGYSHGLTCNIVRFNYNEICASIFTCFSPGGGSKQRACAACVILGMVISCCGFVYTSKLNVPRLTLALKPGGREQTKSLPLTSSLTPHCLLIWQHPCLQRLLPLLGMVWRGLPGLREALARGAPAD